MTVFYLDTSVAVRILFHHSPAAASWFDATTGAPEHLLVSSRLLRTEMTRALRRAGVEVQRRDEVLEYLGTLPVDHAVLQEAEAIVPAVKTLDAIHLASALRSGIEGLVLVTHDRAMERVAAEIGMRTLDPVTDDPGLA